MSINSAQKHKLKKFIMEMKKYRGRHTELVTVYIPQEYDMNKIINHLAQEQGTASNIKSSATRNNVIDALEKMIQHLRVIGRTPEHGLAVFSGNISEREGQPSIKAFSIEPPIPINTRLYRCDKAFVLDILEDMLQVKEAYGLVVLDRRDADIAWLKGKSIIHLQRTHSEVPGKFRAGGQSSVRFARNRELAVKDHYKKVADYVKDQFLGNAELKGIIIGGPGPTKYDFVDGDFLTGDLRKKIIGIKDLGYTGDFGLQELVDKSQDILANEEIMDEKLIMQRFFELLAKEPGKTAYGEKETWEKLAMGVVDVLLISEVVDDETVEKFEKEAERYSSEVKVISTETREGAQLKDLGRIAAILRFDAG